MSGRFVRASKYRHVFGKSTRKEFCYDNLRVSRNAWDTNLVQANPEYLAVNWEASGGGAFAVIPVNERGKLPDLIPLFRGHTAAVLDTDWHPFNDRIIASASDDGKVFIWQVPENFTLHTDEGEEIQDIAPVSRLGGHARKVGQVLFNPAADNVLASASGDLSIKLWDIETGQSPLSLKHNDVVQSLCWNNTGSLLVTTSRDKKLRVWDVRQEKPVQVGQGHEGAKNSRVVWLGDHNRFATTGFSRMSDRQLAVWEPGREQPIGGFTTLDSISGVLMPFYDGGSNCLYLAGKGDGNIRYYEYDNDKFEYLSEYKSADPQRGMAFVPRRGLNVHENEIMRAYKTVNDSYIEPISFMVPRRAETFQSDIFPPATGLKPAESAQEWFSGKTELPSKIDFESIYEGAPPKEIPGDYVAPSSVPAVAPAPAAKPAPAKEPESEPVSARGPPPTMKDQKSSISAMASRFKDDDADASADKASGSDGGAEPSSFDEESSKPAPPQFTTPITSQAQPGAKPATYSSTPAPQHQREPGVSATPEKASPPSHPTPAGQSSSAAVESSLADIKKLLEEQTKIISTQSDKINAQSDRISELAAEVDTLKKKVEADSSAGAGSQDQSERIRELELELEAARS